MTSSRKIRMSFLMSTIAIISFLFALFPTKVLAATSTGKTNIKDNTLVYYKNKQVSITGDWGDIGNIAYTGSDIEPTINLVKKNSVGVLVKGRDYVVTYLANRDIGNATICIIGCGDYTGNLYVFFHIVKSVTPTPKPAATATPTPKSYAIRINNTTNGTASASATSARSGQRIYVYPKPDSGYEFNYMKVNGTKYTDTSFVMPAKYTSIYVYFKAKPKYAITVTTDGNGTAKASKTSGYCGESITVTATANEGYELETIYVNGKAITGNTFTMPQEKVVVEVTFKKIIVSGTCGDSGDNLKWTLDEGTLTVSGEGKMKMWSSVKDVPWYEYRNDIKAVTISKNVTYIGRNAFKDCTNLTSVSIPNTVTSIGNDAFYGCSKLTSITIPNGMLSIGLGVFGNCTDLTKIVIPDSVTKVQQGAFKNCTGLTSITLSKSITTIDNSVFYGCSNLKSITIPDSVKSIGSNAFYGCENLSSINIPESVTSIGNYAFKGCTSLSFVVLNKSAYNEKAFTGISTDYLHYYYNIKYTNDGHGSITGKDKTFGTDTISFKISPDSDYELDKVTLTDANKTIELKPGTSGKYSMPNSEAYATINASFKKIEYSIKVNSATNGVATVSKTKANSGDEIIVNVTPNTGYSLDTIKVNGTAISTNKFTMPAKNTTIAVSFKKNVYTIKVNNDSNGTVTTSKTKASIGDEITVTATPNNGYRLDTITVNGTVISGSKFTMPSRDVIIDVYYKKLEIKLSDSSVILGIKDTYKLAASGRSDIAFKSSNSKIAIVAQDGTITAVKSGSATVTAYSKTDTSVYATCKVVVKYKINYVLNGGTNPSGNCVLYTGTLKLKNSTKTGYTFKGWYSDSKYKKKVTSVKNASKTLYAKWSANTYTIKFNSNGGSGKQSNQKLTYGKQSNIATNKFYRKGYTFIGWNTKANGTGTAYSNKATVKNLTSKNGGSITLYAQWKKNTYKITYSSLPADTTNNNKTSYQITTATFKLSSPSCPGYTFKGWYSNSKKTTKITQIKKGSTGNKTIYAKWTANKYTIQFDANEGIGKMNSMTSREYGKNYTLTKNAFSRDGYVFAGWNTMPDGSGTAYGDGATISNLVAKNGGTIKLYAQWTKVD